MRAGADHASARRIRRGQQGVPQAAQFVNGRPSRSMHARHEFDGVREELLREPLVAEARDQFRADAGQLARLSVDDTELPFDTKCRTL